MTKNTFSIITNSNHDIPFRISRSFQVSYQRGDFMSYKDYLDPHSQLFHHTWTRPKHLNKQINGQTKKSQSTMILKSNAKAHHW